MTYILRNLFIILLFSGFQLSSEAAEPQSEIAFRKISDNFWLLHQGEGYGANIGLVVGDDGILLIDSGNMTSGKKVLKAVRKVSKKAIRYVINTHHHGDHRGGNEVFEAEGATIIYPNYLKYATGYQGASREIQFKDKFRIKMNGEIIELFHLKSHTWNDVIVHLKNNNAVFTGDNHATNWGPQVGNRGMRSHRDVMKLIKSLSDKQTLIVPGHKQLADLNQVQQYDDKTEEWYKLVLAMHYQGMTAEAIFADERIKHLLKWFHGGSMPTEIPQDRLLARVIFTIFAEDKSAVNLTIPEMEQYVGIYQLDDGSEVEIIRHELELYAFKQKTFMALLMPMSNSRFDFNGWNEKERIDFDLDANGHPLTVSFSTNDKVLFSASKKL